MKMRNNNRKTEKIPKETSLYFRVLHQEGKISFAEIKRRYPQYALRSIHRHCKKSVRQFDRRSENKGRPAKLSARDERTVIRSLRSLRTERSSFTANKVQEVTGLRHVSNRTIRRCLNKHGYHYRQSRKKGLVSEKDKKRRLQFARKWVKESTTFWTDEVGFYFDGVSFAHKFHPYGEARSASSMAWRKPNEGLIITTKGKKEGSGGRMAQFFVGIAHDKGVVLCEQYACKNVTGEFFAEFIKSKFPVAFSKVKNPTKRTFLQDGDPKQVSAKAKKAMNDLGYI